MRPPVGLGVAVASIVLALMPAAAAAQARASITGVIRDTSGAVLPGVTVEATSAALIERGRTALSDGTGQYRIVDLPAGAYTVTFSLPGFNTVRREGVELTAFLTATVNIELRVGAIEETVTVSGETPMVDVQSTRRLTTVSGDVLNSLPTARSWSSVALLVPAITRQGTTAADVQVRPGMVVFGTAGGRNGNEGRLEVDGLGTGAARNGGGVSGYNADIANAQEISFTISGGLGEAEVGGPVLSVVPKTGGNTVSGSVYVAGVGSGLVGSNYTTELQSAGLSVPGRLLKLWDVTGGLGGPIKRDRLWFFLSLRDEGAYSSVPGMYANLNAGDPGLWTYQPDSSRQARSGASNRTYALRLTLQASPRNKLNVYWDEQDPCAGATWSADVSGCRRQPASGFVYGGGATAAPETATYNDKFQRVQQVTWTSPLTNRILAEARLGTYLTRWGGDELPGSVTRGLVRMQEQCTAGCPANGNIPNLVYRSGNWASHWMGAHRWNSALSYVTGAHSMKFGYQGVYYVDDETYFTNAQNLMFRVNNGVPNLLTMTLHPHTRYYRTRYNAFYAQEQWTLGRITLQGALRYDHAWSYFPEQRVGPSNFLAAALVFPRTDGVKGYDDISPRFGLAWDVFGTGKTSLKVNLGRYLDAASNNNGTYSITNPTSRIAGSGEVGQPAITRAWSDANRNFVPDCDLRNNAAQDLRTTGGDLCGAVSNQAFGTATLANNFDPAILQGWGVRPADWEIGVSVQQAVLPRISVEVGYFRRWLANFFVNDNLAVGPADFTPFSITAPADPRLPGGGGYLVDGLYDVVPARFGQIDNYLTTAETFGDWSQRYNGVVINVTARARNGLTVQGGLNTGKTVRDNCDIRSAHREFTVITPANASGPAATVVSPTFPYCHADSGWVTRVTGLAVYAIPRIDVQVSGTFRSEQGQPLAANYNVPNAVAAESLGRSLSGNAPFVSVNLIAPGTLYGDRVNDVDMRVAKIFRFGRTRTNVGVDVYNLFNASPVLTYNPAYSTALAWPRPTSVLTPRFAKISAQVDF